MQNKIESFKKNEDAGAVRTACDSLASLIQTLGDELILSINDFSDKDTFIKHVEQFIAKNVVKANKEEILHEAENAVKTYVKHSIENA